MEEKYSTIERSFVMIKPDGVARGLVGKIFLRFEEMGLKLVAARMIKAKKEQASMHYPGDDEGWLDGIGSKTYASYESDEKAIKKDFETTDKIKIGKIVLEAMIKYIMKGPVVITVWEGNHAIDRIRSIVGKTIPTIAEVGSIRGMFGVDTPALAGKTGRITFKTIVHASDSVKEAQRETKIWFGEKYKDLSKYERIDYTGLL